jgi:hypothetical protein
MMVSTTNSSGSAIFDLFDNFEGNSSPSVKPVLSGTNSWKIWQKSWELAKTVAAVENWIRSNRFLLCGILAYVNILKIPKTVATKIWKNCRFGKYYLFTSVSETHNKSWKTSNIILLQINRHPKTFFHEKNFHEACYHRAQTFNHPNIQNFKDIWFSAQTWFLLRI